MTLISFFFFFFGAYTELPCISGAVRDESGHYIHAVFDPLCIHCHIFIIFNFCICTVSTIFCVSPLFCLHFGVSTLPLLFLLCTSTNTLVTMV